MKFPKLIISILIIFITAKADAQKLPSIQEKSVPSPAKVNIDGNINEWGALQAFNKSTSIFYTLANDQRNLYFIVRAKERGIIRKIIIGGIRLSIQDAAKSKSAAQFSATYPLPQKSKDTSPFRMVTEDTTSLTNNELRELNNRLEATYSEIKVKGTTAISDSVISVYNDYGVKIAPRFDTKRAYSCELAIPLRYISQFIDGDGTFNYSIKLNGMKNGPMGGNVRVVVGGVQVDPNMPEIQSMIQKAMTGPGRSGISLMDLSSPTSVSGNYKLSK